MIRHSTNRLNAFFKYSCEYFLPRDCATQLLNSLKSGSISVPTMPSRSNHCHKILEIGGSLFSKQNSSCLFVQGEEGILVFCVIIFLGLLFSLVWGDNWAGDWGVASLLNFVLV